MPNPYKHLSDCMDIGSMSLHSGVHISHCAYWNPQHILLLFVFCLLPFLSFGIHPWSGYQSTDNRHCTILSRVWCHPYICLFHCRDIGSMSLLCGLHNSRCLCCTPQHISHWIATSSCYSQLCWIQIIWQLPKGWNVCALIISSQLLDSITSTGCSRTV